MTALWLCLTVLAPIPGSDVTLPDAAYLLLVDDLTLRDTVGERFPALRELLEASDSAILNCRTRSDSYEGGRINRRAYLHAAAAGRRLPVGDTEPEDLGDSLVRYGGLPEGEPYGRLASCLAQAGWSVVASSMLPPEGDTPPDPGLVALDSSREAWRLEPEALTDLSPEEAARTLVVLAVVPEQAEALAPRLREMTDRTGVPFFVLAMPPRGLATWETERMSLLLRYGTGPGLLGTATTRRAGVMRVTDVGPTVLASLGVEPPLDMEGRAAWREGPNRHGAGEYLTRLMAAVIGSERGRTALFRTLVRAAILLGCFAAAAWPLRGDNPARRLLRFVGLLCLIPLPAFLICFRLGAETGLEFSIATIPLLERVPGMLQGTKVLAYWATAAACAFASAMFLDASIRVRRSPAWLTDVDDFLCLLTRALGLGLLVFPTMLVLPCFTDGERPWEAVYRAMFAAAAAGGFLAALPWRRFATILACVSGPVVFTADQLSGGNLAAFSFFGYCLARDSRLYGMGNSLCILFVVETLLLVGLLAGPRRERSRGDTWRRVALALLMLWPTVVVGAPSLGAQTGGLLYGSFGLALAVGIGFGTVRAVLLWLVGGPLLAGVGLMLGAWLDVRLHKDPTTHFGLALKDVLDGQSDWVRRTMEGRFRLLWERFHYALWWGPIGTAGVLVPWASTASLSSDAPPLAYVAAGLAAAVFAGITDDSGNVMTAMGCVPCIAAVLLLAAGRSRPADPPSEGE